MIPRGRSYYKSLDEKGYALKEIEFLGGKVENRASHLRSCLEHISKGRKRQIVIFLDNIDQRPPGFQEQTFVIGQSLAELAGNCFPLPINKASQSSYRLETTNPTYRFSLLCY